jgi:hypothetical protein
MPINMHNHSPHLYKSRVDTLPDEGRQRRLTFHKASFLRDCQGRVSLALFLSVAASQQGTLIPVPKDGYDIPFLTG